MPDLYDDEPSEESAPEDLCKQAFSRCSNWPQDRLGQIGLAQGLYRASVQFRISQEDLIEKCREISVFCPTDADLMRVAGEMLTARQAAHEASVDRKKEWEREYGPARPADLGKGKCLCCGRDWKEIMKSSHDRQSAMWEALRSHFGVKKRKWPPFREMAPVARQMDYPEVADGWERP